MRRLLHGWLYSMIVLSVLSVSTLSFTACDRDEEGTEIEVKPSDDLEDAGDEVEDAVEDAGDAVEDATD